MTHIAWNRSSELVKTADRSVGNGIGIGIGIGVDIGIGRFQDL
jgi:hypothetical protein